MNLNHVEDVRPLVKDRTALMLRGPGTLDVNEEPAKVNHIQAI